MPIARGALRRRGTLRVPGDVAYRVRIGHPWIFRDALGGRPMREPAGEVVEVVDPTGAFVAKGLYDPDAAIAVRVVTRDVNELVDAALVRRRVATAQALRAGLPELAGLDALRVLTGESEGLPGVTVERYADYLVVHVFTGALVPLLEALYDALEAAYHPRAIYEQRRFRSLGGEAPRGPAELRRGAAAPPEVEVREGALRFGVDVTAPLSTGLFPDLRQGRRAIERRAAGRRVLNLFSYTGAIALYAVRGGAKQVVNVDLAAKAHARARRNFSLSGMNPEAAEYIAEDAMKTLGDLYVQPRRFDLIVLDPPSFGQSKTGVFSTLKDYGSLVGEALKVLDPGGLLVAVANTAKMSIEEHDKAIAEGASRVGADLRIVERCGLPPDYPVAPGFPEGNYLKCAIAVRT
ncbi:MAG TPA: class I SAM-dependent rRNA methyltransferase [Polyangia bacterium]|jgi:23S rRNA (cytosine1962-C5)-methyltransferase